MILDKLAHYRVRGIENNWFKTYLTREWSNIWLCFDRVWGPTGFSSGSTALFDIHYINDLNQAIKFSRVHYFADDTNLLLANDSSKKQQG